MESRLVGAIKKIIITQISSLTGISIAPDRQKKQRLYLHLFPVFLFLRRYFSTKSKRFFSLLQIPKQIENFKIIAENKLSARKTMLSLLKQMRQTVTRSKNNIKTHGQHPARLK